MVLIEWKKEYCTGIKGVDYEHEKLINQINSMYTLIDSRADKQFVIDCLGDIYGDISAHFALEEQTMLKHGYAHYAEHQADHERLLNEIGDITEEFEERGHWDDLAFKQVMSDWFQVHFSTHDSRTKKFLNQLPSEKVRGSTIKALIKKAKIKFSRRTKRQT